MKRTLVLLAILFALPLAAQEVTLSVAEVTPAATKVKIRSWTIEPTICKCANVVITYLDAADGERREVPILVQSLNAQGAPNNNAVGALLAALETARAGEPTGTTDVARIKRAKYRLLAYMKDASLIPDGTLVP